MDLLNKGAQPTSLLGGIPSIQGSNTPSLRGFEAHKKPLLIFGTSVKGLGTIWPQLLRCHRLVATSSLKPELLFSLLQHPRMKITI